VLTARINPAASNQSAAAMPVGANRNVLCGAALTGPQAAEKLRDKNFCIRASFSVTMPARLRGRRNIL
jgi:hypothetical protein